MKTNSCLSAFTFTMYQFGPLIFNLNPKLHKHLTNFLPKQRITINILVLNKVLLSDEYFGKRRKRCDVKKCSRLFNGIYEICYRLSNRMLVDIDIIACCPVSQNYTDKNACTLWWCLLWIITIVKSFLRLPKHNFLSILYIYCKKENWILAI